MDELGLGFIAHSWCVGSLLGAWLARRVRVEQRGARVLALNGIACGIVFAAVGVVPEFWCVLVLMSVGGFSMSLADVVEMTIVQQRVDDALRARVLAAYGALMSLVWGTNLALAGLIVDVISPRAAYIYGGIWCLVSAVGFVLLARTIRHEQAPTTLRALRPRHALK